MPRKILTLLLLLAILILPASAATIVDETLQDSKTVTQTASSTGYRYNTGDWNTVFGIQNIAQYPTINYIAVEFPGNKMPVGISDDGNYPFTYAFGYYQYSLPDTVSPGTVYISRNRDVLGQVTSTRYIYFFYEWDIGTRTGFQCISTDIIVNQGTNCDRQTPTITDDFGVSLVGESYWAASGQWTGDYVGIGDPYNIAVVAHNEWKNRVVVTDDIPDTYKITLYRTIEGLESASALTAGEWYNYGIDDLTWHIQYEDVSQLTITNIFGKEYVFPLTPPTEYDPLESGLYGEVIDIYTGQRISGATITIQQPDIGRTITTTSDVIGRYSVEDSSIQLRADSPVTITATAAGYSNATLSFDAAPRYAEWYVPILMIPSTSPDYPTEPEKTALYGYVVTQGSQQPIQGGTVSLEGVGSTTTSSTGFYIFNNITPATYSITASATQHDTLTESVTADATPTQHNLALAGHHSLTVTVKDADTLKVLTNATTISLSDGQEANDRNPATFAVDYGQYTVTAAAGGYYPGSQYAYIDKTGDTSVVILLTAKAEPTPPPEYPNYPPHNVRFHCIDDFGLPLSNVSVSAAYLETTSPWSWFTDLLGIPSTVAINETTLAGTTGTDGSITFSMVEVVRYAITAHDPASNLSVNFTLYPQETQYTIQFRTRPPSDAETHPIYNLEAVPLEGDTQVSLRLAYKDRDNATTSLLFWVKDGAGEYVYTDTLEPTLLNWTNTSYTVENHPASYTWGFDATHATRDTISAARSITLHGSGRLVDLGFEDEFWYLLLSAIWIVGIGAIFSGSRVRFGAIIIPLIGGGVPTLIGWLPLATTVPIGILTFIGVFVYMRKSEYKLYR